MPRKSNSKPQTPKSTTPKGGSESSLPETVITVAEMTGLINRSNSKGVNSNTMKNPVLKFENKHVRVLFDESADAARPVIIGEGSPWEIEPYMNAFGVLWNVTNPYYRVMEPGMYLHVTLEDAMRSVKNDNVGYVTHTVVDEMRDSRIIRRDLETLPGIYRLGWNGLMFTASDMPYRKYEAGESNQVKWNRNAFHLILALENLRRASETGTNIYLFYTEKMQPRVDVFAQLYALHQAGDPASLEELNAKIKAGVLKASTYRKIAENSNRNAYRRENGKEVVAKTNSFTAVEGEVSANELVGKTIQFVRGGTTLPKQWTVTADEDDRTNGVISIATVSATLEQFNSEKNPEYMQVAIIGDRAEETKKPARKSSKKTLSTKDILAVK